MSLPVPRVRERFPALGGDTVFLDNAAGSQVPRHVVDLVSRTLVEWNANRDAAHRPSVEITRRREEARARAAAFVNASAPREIVFGPNATTLVVLLADAWRRRLSAGDEVIVTGLDHQANVDPWIRLADAGVVVRRWEPTGPHATLDTTRLAALVSGRTKLLAMTGASNALGTIPDVRAAADLIHAAGGLVCVDAVHLAPHVLPDVEALGADMLVFSPYKVFGPHLGVLYMREPLLDELPHHGLSFMQRGDASTWETGTQNHEAIAGLGGTFDYMDELGGEFGATPGRDAWRALYDAAAVHERALCTRMLDGLRDAGAEIYGLPTADGRTSTVSFNLPGRRAREVADHLAAAGVAVSDGHYYAHHLVMHTLGLAARGGAVRVSAVHYNDDEDIARFLAGVGELARAPVP